MRFLFQVSEAGWFTGGCLSVAAIPVWYHAEAKINTARIFVRPRAILRVEGRKVSVLGSVLTDATYATHRCTALL